MREVVIKEFPDLRRVGAVRLRVRVVRLEGQDGARLDIRTYKDGRTPTPWTKKGIRLTAEEFAALLELAPKIQATLSSQSIRPLRKRATRRVP